MKLQYVFEGNPRRKSAKKKVGARKNTGKIEQGGRMAKKKPTKAQLAARAKFVKRFAKGNPKRKRGKKRRNPETVIMEVPVRKRTKITRPSNKDINYAWLKKQMLKDASAEERKKYDSMSPSERDFMVSKAAKKLFKSALSSAEKAVKAEGSLRAKRAQGLHKERELQSKGGEVIMVKENPRKRRKKRKARRKHASANPRKKRKKHAKRKHSKRRKHRRNPSADWGMVTVGNPRRKRRKHSKRRKHRKMKAIEIANPRRKKRRKKHALYYKVGEARMSKRGKRRMKRRNKFVLATNPSVKDLVSVYGVAVIGGAAFPWFNYGVNKLLGKINDLTKGQSGAAIAKVDALAPGVAAPAISLSAVLFAKWADSKYNVTGKLGADASKYIHGALDTIAVLSAAGIGQALAAKAKLDPAGMGMSGVKYFPAPMHGADFGYPQLGQYHQSPGDFGNVKYFPKAPMAGVEFYPPGSNGDEMYRTSEANQLREAEGLGIIPEGMGSADFGIIPEGMGADEGQLG